MPISDAELQVNRTIPPAPPLPQPFVVRSYGLTDLGKLRSSNEDHFVVVELARTLAVRRTSIPQAKAQYSSNRGHIFLVADGMGGHESGEVASALSIVSIESFLLNTLKRFFNIQGSDEHTVMKDFQSALLEADAKIFEEAVQHPEFIGMGTTLTMAFAVNWKLFLAHAGDSRCYLFSKNHLRQLTHDHTVVAELVRRNVLSPAEAATSPFRNVVTNVLGGHKPGVLVELHKLDLEPDDVILLCSDGLTEMVNEEAISVILREEVEVQKACEQLIAQANANGGKDNITAIVARFENS